MTSWSRLEWEGWTVRETEAAEREELEEQAEGVVETEAATVWELAEGVWAVEWEGEWAVVTGTEGTTELVAAISR